MMNGEEMNGGISLNDMEKALVCLLMTSMEAPVQAESAGLTQEMFADASLGFVYGCRRSVGFSFDLSSVFWKRDRPN